MRTVASYLRHLAYASHGALVAGQLSLPSGVYGDVYGDVGADRAGGDAACRLCGAELREHPLAFLGIGRGPCLTLVRDCLGRSWKL